MISVVRVTDLGYSVSGPPSGNLTGLPRHVSTTCGASTNP
jgi:hypothetical protein